MNALRARLQALWARIQQWYAGHARRDQRIILSVLAFAAVCLVYLYGWLPVRDYRERVADETTEGQEQLRRAVRSVGSADSLRVERESLGKKLKQARERLLPGRGATLGAAALQDRTNALAAEKGVSVQSTQVMKDDALPPYRKVSIRLVLSGELQPLAELVSGLEFGQQLAVPFLEVNRRGAVAGAKGPRTLSSTLEVAGFVLAEDAKVDDAAAGEAAPAADTAAGTTTTSTIAPPAAAAGPTTTTTRPPAATASTTTTRPKRPATTTTTRPVPTLPPIVPRQAPAPAAPDEEED